MDIMKLVEFKKRTAHGGFTGKFKSRGRLVQIDLALQSWEEGMNGKRDDKIQLLWLVAKECRRWLKLKAGKTSTNSLRRQQVVRELLAQVMDLFRRIAPDYMRALNKFETGKAHFNPHVGYQSLSGPYSFERSGYLRSGKQYAPSGTLLGDAYNDSSNTYKAQFGNKKFSDFTEADYDKLDNLMGANNPVLYLHKLERLKLMAIPNGELFYNFRDDLFSMDEWDVGFRRGAIDYDKGGGWPYAVDRYGNLFTIKISGSEQINHSTLNAGNMIICAGMLKLWQGEMLMISNNSGHYKPPRRQLHKLLVMYHEMGVRLSHTHAQVWEPARDGNGMEIFIYNAEEFATHDEGNPPALIAPIGHTGAISH